MKQNLKTSEETRQKAIEKRNELKALSAQLKPIAKEQEVRINELLVEYYMDNGCTDLRTFEEWRKAGYIVKRGESSYLVWGKPIATQKAQKEAQEKNEETKEDYFPVCHLFDRSQVHKLEPKA